MSADPAFLRFYADAVETEAQRRQHQLEFAAWLMQCADKARREAETFKPIQGDLFQ